MAGILMNAAERNLMDRINELPLVNNFSELSRVCGKEVVIRKITRSVEDVRVPTEPPKYFIGTLEVDPAVKGAYRLNNPTECKSLETGFVDRAYCGQVFIDQFNFSARQLRVVGQ
ncbi:hypothetical protein HYU14_06005 [Candidatus Woesearchaeota archaeon]|nr:hypothetical protein [Candidatus Woesearchaeota archaeon]